MFNNLKDSKMSIWKRIRLLLARPRYSVDLGTGESYTVMFEYKIIDGVAYVTKVHKF